MLGSASLPRFQEEGNFVKGEFTFPDFKNRPSNDNSRHFSQPILVDGSCFRLVLDPKGEDGAGRNTHIAVGIYRNRLTCLNVDKCNQIVTTRTMLHSSDSAKNKILESLNDLSDTEKVGFITELFYPISDIEKDGFLHQDGSLRFEFSVRKHNFMKKAQNLRRLITCLSTTKRRDPHSS